MYQVLFTLTGTRDASTFPCQNGTNGNICSGWYLNKFYYISFTWSSSFFVSSSIRRMSSIDSSIHLSIQQNSCLWKWVNKRFSTWTQWDKWEMTEIEMEGNRSQQTLRQKPISTTNQIITIIKFLLLFEWSSPSCFVVPATWIQQWLTCRHTCEDSLCCWQAHSADLDKKQKLTS